MAFADQFPAAGLQALLLGREQWKPMPTAADREAWQALPRAEQDAILQAGDEALAMPWPHVTATSMLEFVRSGDRAAHEKPHSARRSALIQMVLAECLEDKGRFVDPIINAAWSICEESYWGWAAHLGMQQNGAGLADIDDFTVDLGVGESAALMAWVLYLIGDRLDAVSPLIRRRIEHEIHQRILRPCRFRRDFGWMGLVHDRPINNWSVWIVSNWLTCLLLVEHDPRLRAGQVHKCLQIIDRFVAGYGDDGGCDEGPRYWTVAAGALYDCAAVLHSASGGKVDLLTAPKLREMGAYLHRMHIHGRDFVNFGDTEACMPVNPSVLRRFGRDTADRGLVALGNYLASLPERQAVRFRRSRIGHRLASLFDDSTPADAPVQPPLARDVWLPSIQTMVARDAAGSAEGLFVAAKAAHNGESHNHNDVGQFIVYLDGQPLIVDPGVANYTRQTFSSERYSIWTMQSAWHNLPGFAGVMQSPGGEFTAREVVHAADDAEASLSMDLAGAYPAEAGVTSYRRLVRLRRGQDVTVEDRYELSRDLDHMTLALLFVSDIVSASPDRIVVKSVALPSGRQSASGAVDLEIPAAEVSVQTQTFHDPVLSESWPDRLYRVLLTVRQPRRQGGWRLTVKRG